VDHLAKPEVQRAYYEFLMARDLSAYPKNFNTNDKPITDFYIECQSRNIPVVSRFLSALLTSRYFADNNKNIRYFTTNQLFKLCQKFADENNYSFNKNSSSFGKEIKKINGIESKNTNQCNGYTLNNKLILGHLNSTKHFDDKATLPDTTEFFDFEAPEELPIAVAAAAPK
jgi:hypothetical protein